MNDVEKEHPYNPYTRAKGFQEYCKECPSCGAIHWYFRENGHQHWRHSGPIFFDIVEINGVVYLNCSCGEYIRTRLKPMSASLTLETSIKWGLLEESEPLRGIGILSRAKSLNPEWLRAREVGSYTRLRVEPS